MNTQRMVFAFLSGLLLLSFSGCGGGGTGGNGTITGEGDGKKVGTDNTRNAANAATANAWIDNYTPRTCAVTLDGENKGTLEAFASQLLEVAPGTHTFLLTCEGQPAETIKADIPRGKTVLVRPTAAGDYLILSRPYTAAGASANGGEITKTPAPKTGVITADYGPLKPLPDTLSGDEATAATRTGVIRALPNEPDLPELACFITGDFRIYGIADAQGHRDAIVERLKRLEPRAKDAAVGDMLIRTADKLSICAAGNNDLVAIGDAVLGILKPQQERVPDEKLLAWLGFDAQTGKARVLPEGQRINPSIAAAAVSLLLQRNKHEQLVDRFPVLPADAARAMVASLANPPAPEELRRRVVLLGLRRREATVLKEACAALSDKDFVPDEEMAEALTATIDQLNPEEGDHRATIKHCSSCLVDAFYRHPAVVAREKTRRFLVRFAHPGLEPTLENARYALIEGRCASDLVPIYTHYTRDERIEMIGRLVAAARKREAVGQDLIDLHRVALADEDTEVRITAAKALLQFAAFITQDNLAALQDLLVRALHDPSLEVHHEAAQILDVKGFVPTEQIADGLVAAWRQLDETDPQGKANREHLAKLLKTNFEKNPGIEADKPWRERALAAMAQ